MYYIVEQDGTETGPFGFETMQQFAREGRLKPESRIRETSQDMVYAAGQESGLFPVPSLTTGPTAYPRPGMGSPPVLSNAPLTSSKPNERSIAAILWSVGGLLVFMILHGYGVFIAAASLYRAFEAKKYNEPMAVVALCVTSLVTVAIVVGLIIRFQSA